MLVVFECCFVQKLMPDNRYRLYYVVIILIAYLFVAVPV